MSQIFKQEGMLDHRSISEIHPHIKKRYELSTASVYLGFQFNILLIFNLWPINFILGTTKRSEIAIKDTNFSYVALPAIPASAKGSQAS